MRQLTPIICLLFFSQYTAAQCSLACVNSFIAELDVNCEYTANTADLLALGCSGGIYLIEVFDQNGILIPGSPTVDGSFLGINLSYTITETNSGNSCFGNITLEDNIFPVISCPSDIEVECFPELIPAVPTITDNCNNNTVLANMSGFTPFSCDPDHVGMATIFFEVTDAGGNSVSCFSSALVNRMDLSQVVFPPDFLESAGTDLSCSGDISPAVTQFPSYLGVSLDQGNYPDCNITISYTDVLDSSNSCLLQTERTWTIDEAWCGTNVSTTAVQHIEQTDEVGPSLVCVANFSLPLDPSGNALLDPSMIDGGTSDNCSSQITFTLSQSIFDCSHLGINTVFLTATDECGNSNSCFSTIEIMDTDGVCPPPPTLFVTGTLDADENYCAGETIESDAQALSTTTINFNAAESILLMAGFEVILGSDFSANIGPCID